MKLLEEKTKEELHEMRAKFNTPNFKKKVWEMHGGYCVNCGSGIEVELHHIVPLSELGTNNIRNIVPLCHKCHSCIHFPKAKWETKRAKNYGRPRKIPGGYEQTLDDYLHCRISMSDVRERFGWTKDTQRLKDRAWFKEYLLANDVTKYRNNIDIIMANKNKGLSLGRALGYLVQHGERQVFYYQPENPDVD